MSRFPVALTLAASCACNPAEPEPQPADPEPVFAPADCVLPLTGAECGTVTVPEIHGSGSDRTITLATAVLPATSGVRDAPPLVLFNGGPGSSIFDLGDLFLDGAFGAPLNVDRDIVLFSERGTTGAEPLLDCPELSALDAIFDAPVEELDAARLTAYTDCADRLRAADVDLGAFSDDQRAADVPEVLGALGYDQWHLWGVSGGAVLVQRVVRDYPDGTVTAMVDSGAFPEPSMTGVFQSLIVNADARYDRMFAECAADPVCGTQFPDFEPQLLGLVAALEAEPRIVPVTHPITGETRDFALDGDRLMQLYTNSMALVGSLPIVTFLAANGDFSAIDPQLGGMAVSDTGPSFADGLFQSVACGDLGDMTLADVPTDGARPELTHALSPTLAGVFDQCAAWDVPALPSGGPVGSDTIPILIMEGMFDTNRDPELSDEVADRFDTAWVAQFGDRGHVVFGDCAISLMGQFMDDPTQSPDMSCVPAGVTWTPLY